MRALIGRTLPSAFAAWCRGRRGRRTGGPMPYDPVELVELPTEVLAVVTEMRAATRASSDGGTKVTRAERRRIVRAALHLAYVLTRDGID